MSDIDQASISQSRSRPLDQSALSNSRYNDDGESESGLDASVGPSRPEIQSASVSAIDDGATPKKVSLTVGNNSGKNAAVVET